MGMAAASPACARAYPRVRGSRRGTGPPLRRVAMAAPSSDRSHARAGCGARSVARGRATSAVCCVLLGALLVALGSLHGAMGDDGTGANSTTRKAPKQRQVIDESFMDDLAASLKELASLLYFGQGQVAYDEEGSELVTSVQDGLFVGGVELHNYTGILSELGQQTLDEIDQTAEFLSLSKCYFPINGSPNIDKQTWTYFLAMRAELTSGDDNSTDEAVDDIPWAQFPIICTNRTVSLPGWLGTFEWLNPLVTSISTPLNVFVQGQLSPAIGNLLKLTTISVQGGVEGTIPPSIGKLKQLRSLLLQDNELSGTIPEEIGFCRRIQKIWLSNNNLSGTIPESLANLTNLEEFYAADNNLSGTLSPELMSLRDDLGQKDFQVQGNPLYNSMSNTIVPEKAPLQGWEIAVIVLASCLAAATLVVAVGWAFRRHNRKPPASSTEMNGKQKAVNDIVFEGGSAEDHSLSLTSTWGSNDGTSEFCINKKDLQLVELLGRGSYGTVFKARWGKKDVAVKIMNMVDHVSSREDSRKVIRTFEKEVDYLSKFLHRNIVRLYGYSLAPPNVYIVQELMSGSLHELLRSEQYVPNYVKTLTMIEEIAAALAYLHPRIVHCDLKPQNILLNEAGEVKIADFGISRSKQGTFIEFTVCNHVPGSVIYMAPECFNAPQEVCEKCDVYSLAMIMWECYSGVEPWHELPNPVSVVNAVAMRDRRPAIPLGCPPKFSRLIEKCWATDYNKRPSCAEIAKHCRLLRQDLQASAEGDSHRGKTL